MLAHEKQQYLLAGKSKNLLPKINRSITVDNVVVAGSINEFKYRPTIPVMMAVGSADVLHVVSCI